MVSGARVSHVNVCHAWLIMSCHVILRSVLPFIFCPPHPPFSFPFSLFFSLSAPSGVIVHWYLLDPTTNPGSGLYVRGRLVYYSACLQVENGIQVRASRGHAVFTHFALSWTDVYCHQWFGVRRPDIQLWCWISLTISMRRWFCHGEQARWNILNFVEMCR